SNFSDTVTLTPQQKQRILEQRARALAQSTMQDSEQGETLRVVEFALAQQRYAVETSYVREVQHVAKITPIPCTPFFILGVIQVGARFLSVFDLRAFFALPHPRSSQSDTVIVFGDEELEVGVLTDGLIGAHVLPIQAIRSAPAGFSGIRREYLQGIAEEQLL